MDDKIQLNQRLPFPCPVDSWHCHSVRECDSTNTLAAQLLKHTPRLFIRTDHQTAGRGQRGTTWSDQPGQSLLCSLGIKALKVRPEEAFYITMQASLGVRNLIESILPEQQVRIKWPNDILVNGDKIAGILVENQLRGQFIRQSIIGIGINLNQLQAPYPNTTSLRLISGQTYAAQKLAAALREALSRLPATYQTLRQVYLRHLLAYQSWYLFERNSNQESFMAKIIGVDVWGRLHLQHPDQHEEYAEVKALKWISPVAP